MLDWADALRAHGHDAWICAPPDFREDVEGRGVPFRAVGGEVRVFLAAHAAAVARGGLAAFRTACAWFGSALEWQFDVLPEAARGADILVGAGVQIAGPSVAEHLGIPYRFVTYCPVLLPSAQHAPPILPRSSLGAGPNRALWWMFRAFTGHLLRRPLDARRAAMGLPPVRNGFLHLLSDRPLVAADPELAPVPPDCPVAFDQIGCLHAPDPSPLPPKVEAFLSQGPPPVYLGFGSMTDPDPAATTRLMIRAATALGVRALIGRGWAGLGGGPLPDDILAIGPVSHAALFPRCAAVVHHGGAGTTTVAARAGVPQVVVPHLADQFYWADRVFANGLGPVGIPRHRLTAERLTTALAGLRDNELVAERAAEFGERVRARRPLDGDPVRLLAG
jgi:vancomycin aglycone glucosyltransferase